MDSQTAQFVGLGLTAALFLSVATYLTLAWRVWQRGGRAMPEQFGLGDLFTSLVLISFFTLLGVQRYLLGGEKAPMKPDQVLPSSLLLIMIVLALSAFMRMRGIRVRELFRLHGRLIPAAAGRGTLLLLAALPMLYITAAVVQSWLQTHAVEQEMVQLFREVVKQHDYRGAVQIVLAGAVIAPLTEEFLFRGYFYGTFKRYVGALGSASVTSLLFAASHANLASLPALFLLALCFAVAYELSGTLLVPMAMHALFNSTSLALLYWEATRSP